MAQILENSRQFAQSAGLRIRDGAREAAREVVTELGEARQHLRPSKSEAKTKRIHVRAWPVAAGAAVAAAVCTIAALMRTLVKRKQR
jgi:hypothetical protein